MEKLTVNELLKKLEDCKQQALDLSLDEDLSVAVMNLISLEEHFFFTGAKTGKPSYYDLLDQTRAMRKELLAKLVKNPEGEVWCISKHLLAATMRLLEVGTKYMGQNKKTEAAELFAKAYTLYSLFWALNLNMIDVSDVKQIDETQLKKNDTKKSVLDRIGDLVKKVINCCIE